jgi:hypothetical protein
MTLRGPLALALLVALALPLTATHPGGAATPAGVQPWKPTTGKPASEAGPAAVNLLPDSTVLARFQGDPIRASEVVARYYDALPNERPEADSSGRAQWLHTMVDQRVMGALAREVNRPFGFEDRATMRGYEQRILSNEVFQRYVLDSLVEDTTAAHRLWDEMLTIRHLRWMLCTDKATATRVRDALAKKTMTWADAYAKYHRGIKRPDLGELPWMDRLSSTDMLPPSVYQLKAGEVSEAWSDIGGWNLISCTEVRPATRPLFKIAKGRLETVTHQHQISVRSERLLAELRARAHVTYDTANVVWVSERFVIADLEGGTSGAVRITHAVPIFAPEDTGRVLARSDGGALSINAFMHAYTELPPVARPLVNTPERLRRQIDATLLEPERANLARARGWDRDSTVIVQIQRRREALMVEHLFADSVESRVQVTAQMRRQFYEKNLPEFVTYARVRYAIFAADRKTEADSLAARLRGGEKAADILRADSLAHRPKRGSVRWIPQNEEGTPFHALLFEELKPGQLVIQGPDNEGAYAVIQSIEFDPGRQLSFEESQDMVDASLQNIEGERLLRQFVDRHRKRYRIEEHANLVNRVAWRDPTMPR